MGGLSQQSWMSTAWSVVMGARGEETLSFLAHKRTRIVSIRRAKYHSKPKASARPVDARRYWYQALPREQRAIASMPHLCISGGFLDVLAL